MANNKDFILTVVVSGYIRNERLITKIFKQYGYLLLLEIRGLL